MACGASRKRDGHSSATPVARRLKQPTRTATRTRVEACASMPSLFGLAPGGVCRAASVAGNAVRSYRTFSPLPRPIHNAAVAVRSLWHCPWGRPRRTLSGTVCPGARTFLPGHLSVIAGAAVQPTDRIGMGPVGCAVKSRRAQAFIFGEFLVSFGAGGLAFASSSRASVSRVEVSAMPSTCAGRKWRWKAVTTIFVASSYSPVTSMP